MSMSKSKKVDQDPLEKVKHVPSAPTIPPRPQVEVPKFDIRDVFEGTAPLTKEKQAEVVQPPAVTPDEKARQAYFWIVNNAIISPFYDIEFNEGNLKQVTFTGVGTKLSLPSEQSYSSFVILPLLNFLLRKRALFIGGPGRGKTASSILMGLLAGYSIKDLHRAILHGQPQLTVADMLGTPLPKDLLAANQMEEIRIAWRRWLDMRVKIVDEYNRIPTRTQSALLTLIADGYAEIMDQVVECGESAWFLTANDDLGGGTYQVIEALKDRIDIVVRALNFNSRFLEDLLFRIEHHFKPEEIVPPQIIFSPEELDLAFKEIMKVTVPPLILRRLQFFMAQFEFCDLSSEIAEYKSKDYIRMSGKAVSQVCKNDCGRDKIKALCSQTENGISVRAHMAILHFAKALAYFRGHKEVEIQDLRQIIPWLLHEKLTPNATSAFFDGPGNNIFRVDKIAWIRKLFDLSLEEYERLDRDKADPVKEIGDEIQKGLSGLDAKFVREQLDKIEKILQKLAKETKLFCYLYDDILTLKSYYMRYQNYLRWLDSENK